MLYVAIAQLVVIMALLYMLWRIGDAHSKIYADFAKQAEAERRELLNRIAQPGMIVPSPTVRHERPPPRDAKQYGAVGTIQKPKTPDA